MSLPYSVYPQVGQKLDIMHRSEANVGSGLAMLKRASKIERTIAQVYLCEDGVVTVRDNAGETWAVKPGRLNTWETFTPKH